MGYNLTELQQKFVDEYVKDRNGPAAVRRAGYSEKRVPQTSYELLKNDNVIAAIDAYFKDFYERNKMNVDEAISILTDIARTEPADLYNPDGTLKRLHDIPKFARHAIDSVKFKTKYVWDDILEKNVPFAVPTEIKMTSKQTAIEKILRHLGGFEKDNTQKKADPIVLNINPLGMDTDTIDISHTEPGPLMLGEDEELY